MRWKPWALLPLPPTVTALGVLQILSWGAVTAAEELLQHCRDGTSQAEHKGRAQAPDSWRGERGTRGEVRAVPLLNELGKVMRGWLEPWGRIPQCLNGHLHPSYHYSSGLIKIGLWCWCCSKHLYYTAGQGKVSVLFQYFVVRENIQRWCVGFDVLDGSNVTHHRGGQ